jgi:hypothetical protein
MGEHCSGVTTWQVLASFVVVLATLRIAISKIAARFCQAVVDHASTIGKPE